MSRTDAAGVPTAGVHLPSGGGAWSSISDRALKENFAPVDPKEILARLVSLSIESWNYLSQDPAIRHIGPTAQDFRSAFGVGEDERHISTLDADGVALAAIQGLHQLLQERDAELKAQEAKITALQEHSGSLEARLAALEGRASVPAAAPAGEQIPFGWPMIASVLLVALALGRGVHLPG